MTEGNIDNRRDEDGIIFNDGSAGSIGTVNNYYGSTNPYKAGIPFQVPPVPQHFVPRPQYADRVRNHLLCDDPDQPGTLVVSAIHGLGGIGKSVLAQAIAHEPEIRDRFPDGILWITLGQQPDLLVALGDWIRSLGDRDYKPTTVQAASSYLRSLLVDKTMLLVVDDLWDPAHFDPFRLAGKGCRVLVTTRQVRLTNAKPCELGLLTAAESVALVERRLGQGVEASEREIFEEFARAVGFLPLALELAAVQVEDGYDWASLLADFREEFDILDVDEGVGSDEERRDRSLRACFNLSLKRLDGEQLRRFAWLGVLPEDVSVDARMVATLWGVKPVRARKGLLELRRRSLLLSGVSVSVAGRQEPTFRQHDLLHELAQKQLAEGLGLSVEVAHGELLARYRPESGRWWELADDGYIHRRLTWHMERAGQIAEMHKLIRAADDNGRNAWGEACEELGLLTVFVEDVARAWRCAEERYGVIPTEAEGWRWQFWCAFAMGSLNSLVGNIPGMLLATAVRQGHWSEARAVAYALQKRDESERAQALVALIPECQRREIVEEAIQAARGMVSAWNYDRVLMTVIKCQSVFVSKAEALQITRQISDQTSKAYILLHLAKQQPELGLLDEVLEITHQVSNEFSRLNILLRLAEQLPQLYREALGIIRQEMAGEHFSSEYRKAEILRELAGRLPQELYGEALEITRQISDDLLRVWVLCSFTKDLQELFDEVLEDARQLSDESSKALVMTWLAEHRPESGLLHEVLVLAHQSSDEDSRVKVLACLAEQKLEPELFYAVLAMARQVSDMSIRASILIQLTECKPELLSEALDVTRQIFPKCKRADKMLTLAEQYSELFDEALNITRQIADEYFRAVAICKLAKKQPELFDEALTVTRQVSSDFSRSRLLVDLAKTRPELLVEGLQIARQLSSKSDRAEALWILAEQHPNLFSEALEVTLQISHEFDRGRILGLAVKKFPPQLFNDVLDVLYKIPDGLTRVGILIALAKQKPELFDRALQSARKIPDYYDRALALNSLLEQQPELFDEVLETTLQISNEYDRAMGLKALAEQQPELGGEALIIARKIPDESSRAGILRALASTLTPDLYDSARIMAITIRDPYHRAKALAGFTDRTSWEAIARDHGENLLRLLSTRERKHLIDLLPKLHPTLLELGGQPAVDAALDAMRDACNQWP